MASLHSHRKLLAANAPHSNLTDTTDEPTVQTCLYFCDTQRNNTLPYTGFCPQVCLAICPSVCQYPLSNLPLPQDFPPSKPNKSHNLSPLLICMLILLATTFLLIALYLLYTKLCYNFYVPNRNSVLQTRTRRRRRESSGSYSLDEEQGNRMVFNPFWCIPTVGLPPMAISSIPVHKYGKEVEERDCAVCLAEFEEGDELRVLPKCNHAFHIACIDTWLSSHTTCPLCRAPIIPPDDGDHDQDHDHHHKDENTSSSLTSVERAAEDDSPAAVLSIHVISGEEEVQVENTSADPIENNPNKDQEGEVVEGNCSQTWSLERGAANLLSRSLSCSGKIFSSRSNIRPDPNS